MGARPSFPLVTLPSGTVAIVTGSNTGIGYEAAKYLAIMGATVILACRSEERARNAIERMKKEVAEMRSAKTIPDFNIPEEISVEFMKLDLSSLKSTVEFITAFKTSGKKLQLLLCNAAYFPGQLEFTEDGYEAMFQVNYLGHFLVVAHLVPIMKHSGNDCRIVFTSSTLHKMTGGFDLTRATAKEPDKFNTIRFYGKSKVYQIQQMFTLVRLLEGCNVSVSCVHPGFVTTEINRHIETSLLGRLTKAAYAAGFSKTPYQGAITLIDAAVNPKWKGHSGLYLEDCKVASVSAEARNQEYQTALWNYSFECLKDYIPDDLRQQLQLPQTTTTATAQ